MSDAEQDVLQSDEGVTLAGLYRLLYAYKVLIIAITLLAIAAAVVFAMTSESIYRAEVILTEARDQSMNPMASMANQFGGLANLAGVNVGGGGDARKDSQAVLTSRLLAEKFIVSQKLAPALFPQAKSEPSLWQAVRRFRSNVLSIRDDVRKGTTTVSIEWTDAAIAANWANEYVALANDLLRTRAIDDSKRNVDFLTQQIALTDVLEIKRVMYNLIETETKTLMLANARPEYAFRIVDPAVPSEMRIKPQRSVIVVLGAALGFLLGAVIALVRDRIKSGQRSAIAGVQR